MKIIDANALFGFWPKRKVEISLKRLLEMMQQHKVEQSLSLSTKGILYDYEEGNRETLEVSKKHPEIIPVATVDLRKYFGKGKVIRKLAREGFKTLRLFPNLQNWPLNYQPFNQVVEEIKETKLPLMISVTRLGGITEVGKAFSGCETAIILTSVNYGSFAEALAVMKRYRNVYIETSLFDTPDSYEIFVRELGAERIIFGSYSPFHYFSSSFLPLERAEISDKEKRLIAAENIKRLLKDENN